MGGGGYANEYSNFRAWYERAGQLGLVREVALADFTGANEPSSSTYKTELESLLKEFTGVSYVEAWNEPNHASSAVKFYVKAVAAAHYMNEAYSVCQVHACTAIAGDFLDESNMSGYEAEYISGSNLNPKDPPNWGMHPYAAVDTEKTTTVEAFRNGLPGKGSENISFTEVGAYYCKKGESVSGSENASHEAYQAKHAAYLVNTLIPHTTNLEHVLYYEFAFEGTKRINCSNVEDTELYAPPSEGQANQPRSAASIVWGPEGRPSASTGAASNLAPLQATLNGSVNPKGLADTKYYFQYGTTTEYGSGATTPGDAGQGLNWQNESTPIGGLQPGTTYHFRIVATNEDGTEEGKDGEFTTPGPVEAVTAPPSGITEEEAHLNGTVNPRGYEAKYYFRYGTGTNYSMTTPESSAGAGKTPMPVSATVTAPPGTTYHYRLVATSGGVTSEGEERTVMTLDTPPSMVVDKENNRWVAVEGAGHTLDVYEQFQSNGKWLGPVQIGGAGTTYAAPSMAVNSEDNIWIATEGPSHTLDIYWQNAKTAEWAGPGQITGPGSTYSAPSLAIDKENNRWIAAEGSSNSLFIEWQNAKTAEWAGPGQIAGAGTTFAAPSTAFDHEDDLWIATEGASNSMNIEWLPSSTKIWAGPGQIAGPSTTYAAPSLAIDKYNQPWIATEGASNSMNIEWLPSSTKEWAGPGQIAGAGTTFAAPSTAFDHEDDLWIATEGASNSMNIEWLPSSTKIWAGPGQIAGPSSTYAAPSLAIDNGNDRWIGIAGPSNSTDIEWQNALTAEWAGPGQIGASGTPNATTEPASALNATTVTVNGSVDPLGVATTYHFEYGTTTSYGTSVPTGGAGAGSGESAVVESANLSGLQPATLYHYRIVATNSAGTTYGVDRVFTTTSWGTETTINATGAPNNRLTGVSCSSSMFCLATGYETYNGVAYAYTESWNGSTWTAQGIESNGGMQLDGVSCTSSTACTAVGSLTETTSGNVVTVAERWNGIAWTRQTTINATGAPNNRLTGVSCSSSMFCLATGYETYNGVAYAYTESWNGSTWTAQGIESNGGMQLDGVSCTSSTACTAVGSLTETTSGNVVTVAERWNGIAWTRQTTINATGAPNNRLTGVSCSSSMFCLATGYETYNGVAYAYTESWNGSTWTAQGIESNGGMQLDGVSCTSSTACTAVGSLTETTSGNVVTVAERWNGIAWTRQTTPNELGANGNQLTAVSCSSVCTGVGGYTNSTGVWTLAEGQQ